MCFFRRSGGGAGGCRLCWRWKCGRWRMGDGGWDGVWAGWQRTHLLQTHRWHFRRFGICVEGFSFHELFLNVVFDLQVLSFALVWTQRPTVSPLPADRTTGRTCGACLMETCCSSALVCPRRFSVCQRSFIRSVSISTNLLLSDSRQVTRILSRALRSAATQSWWCLEIWVVSLRSGRWRARRKSGLLKLETWK